MIYAVLTVTHFPLLVEARKAGALKSKYFVAAHDKQSLAVAALQAIN